MKIRQALKVRDRLGVLDYVPLTLAKARLACRRHKHRAAKKAGINPRTWVTIKTSTAYDSEGVPVGVRPGSLGYVVELDGFPQVLCNTFVGTCAVGIPADRLERRQDIPR